MADSIRGKNWSPEEVFNCVGSYLRLLKMQVSAQTFNKAQVYRELSETSGRTVKSIEWKFQNISAVLDELGFDWIVGLPPAANYQQLLIEKIEEHSVELASLSELGQLSGFSHPVSLYVEPPPERETRRSALPKFLERLVRKFDPVERDMKNRALGEAGEELVLNHEITQLSAADRTDLSKNVRWVSKLDGDGAGYDILSFDPRGEKKYIEVKTTIGGNRTPFFISRNEHSFAKNEPDRFTLFRVFDFRKGPRAFELVGPLEKFLRLSTETFRADFRA